MNITTESGPEKFKVDFPGFGVIQLRKISLDDDVAVLHDWFSRDYSKFWGMQGKSVQDVREKYAEIIEKGEYEVLMGTLLETGEKIFMLEFYDPRKDIIKNYYDVESGDRGFHLIVAPVGRKISNITFYIFSTIKFYVFNDASIQRLIGEPDIRNEKVLIRLVQAGFNFRKVIHLPYKTAWLIDVTRRDFSESTHVPPPVRSLSRFRALHVRYHLLAGRVWRKLAALSGKTSKAQNTA